MPWPWHAGAPVGGSAGGSASMASASAMASATTSIASASSAPVAAVNQDTQVAERHKDTSGLSPRGSGCSLISSSTQLQDIRQLLRSMPTGQELHLEPSEVVLIRWVVCRLRRPWLLRCGGGGGAGGLQCMVQVLAPEASFPASRCHAETHGVQLIHDCAGMLHDSRVPVAGLGR